MREPDGPSDWDRVHMKVNGHWHVSHVGISSANLFHYSDCEYSLGSWCLIAW